MSSIFDTNLTQEDRDRFAETAELVAGAAKHLAAHIRAGDRDKLASVSLVFLTATGGRLIDELSEVFSRTIDMNIDLKKLDQLSDLNELLKAEGNSHDET